MRLDLSQPAQHNSDHADVQPSFGVGGLNFIMAHQAAMFHKPAEHSFDDPAFAQHFEAKLVLEARHDLQPQGARLALRRDPSGQLISAVARSAQRQRSQRKPASAAANRRRDPCRSGTSAGVTQTANSNPNVSTKT